MDEQLTHIIDWVGSKGVKIVYIDECGSHFKHSEPDTVFIATKTKHKLPASILHEYYHTRQFKRCKLTAKLNADIKLRANIEYRAEAFVIRCFKKLDIIYDKTFVENNWCDCPYLNSEVNYYMLAHKLLIKNKLL